MGRKIKFDVDDNYFDVIDNQDKAYFLGLLYADGCNYENQGLIKIDLITEDRELLEKFKKSIKYNGYIHDYKSEIKVFNNKEYVCKPMSRLSFRSKRISEQLSLKGCMYNKTYLLKFPNNDIVPNVFLKDFIRGYFDGDGGISYWVDNKNTGHKKFQINFCGTTDIINNISKILGEKFNCYPAISDRYKERDNNNLQVNICGNNIVKNILDWLYKDANIYMKRKHNKYLELLEEVERVKNDKNLYGSAKQRKKVIRLCDLKIYNSLADAYKDNGYSGSSVIFNKCKKKDGFMYLEEYLN